jgi:glycosyltransferase involved in cell wall biosynthesis
MKKLSIIIPVYNEEKTIQFVLDKIKKVELISNIKKEIILVNDASKDGSKFIIENYMNKYGNMDIHFYEHKKNM